MFGGVENQLHGSIDFGREILRPHRVPKRELPNDRQNKARDFNIAQMNLSGGLRRVVRIGV